jgi:hypothetical protein
MAMQREAVRGIATATDEMLLAELGDDAGIELGNVIDEKGKMLV